MRRGPMYKTRYAAMIAFFTALISVTVFITESVFDAAGSNAPTTPSTCALYGTCYALGWEEYSVDETPPGTKNWQMGT